MMLIFELQNDGQMHLSFIGQLGLANCQSGSHEAWQGFIGFTHEADFPLVVPRDTEFRFGGLEIEVTALLFIQSDRKEAAPGAFMDPAETGALDACSAKAVCDRVIRPLADRSLDAQRAAVVRVTSVQHEAIDDIWGIRRIIGVDETWATHEVCSVPAKKVQAVGTPRPPKFKDSFALLPPVVHGSGRNNSDNRKRDIALGAALLPPHVPLMDEEHEGSDGSDRGDYDEAGDEDDDDAGDTDTSASNPEEGDDGNEEEN